MANADPSPPVARFVREAVAFLRAFTRRVDEDRCFEVAGSLTYSTLLALVPILTVALSVAAAFPLFTEWTGRIDRLMFDNLLPPSLGAVVSAYLAEFAAKAAQLRAIGLAFLFLAAGMLVMTIGDALHRIFRVPRARPFAKRLLIYAGVLILGPLLVGASLTMTSYLVGIALGWARGSFLGGEVLLRVVPVLLGTLALTLLYITVPNRKVRLREAVIGGFLASAAFELMKRGFAFYVAKFPTYNLVYGAFAVIPLFLLWLYLSWAVVMLGATLTAFLLDLPARN
jgi:membrane protein